MWIHKKLLANKSTGTEISEKILSFISAFP